MSALRDLLLTMSTYRSERRIQIVDTILSAPVELVDRPSTIAGGVDDGSIGAAFAHVVDVEKMWLQHCLLTQSDRKELNLVQRPSLASLADLWQQTSADWERFIHSQSEQHLQRPHVFHDGTAVPMWLVVIHAYNHTTHHVSEIWTALTAAGIQPVELSLMQWARQHDWS